ncbi:MAG: Uma2 family endonuclease [Thermomicrobiales bacterium]
MATTTLMTADELLRMQSDEFRYDLIRGELRRMSPAGFRHGKIAMRVSIPLGLFVDEHDLGDIVAAETGFRLDRHPEVVLGPDLAFVRAGRIPPDADQDRYLELAPDLVLEVVSPGTPFDEVMEKVDLYVQYGVPLVWLALPKRRVVMVFAVGQPSITLHEDDILDGGDVLPGFRLPVADIFR